MPYINASRRRMFDLEIDELVERLGGVRSGFHPGDLNYCLSRIIWGLWEKSACYEVGNKLMGVLECVKQEFYRRMLAPYEDKKWAHEGDIV